MRPASGEVFVRRPRAAGPRRRTGPGSRRTPVPAGRGARLRRGRDRSGPARGAPRERALPEASRRAWCRRAAGSVWLRAPDAWPAARWREQLPERRAGHGAREDGRRGRTAGVDAELGPIAERTRPASARAAGGRRVRCDGAVAARPPRVWRTGARRRRSTVRVTASVDRRDGLHGTALDDLRRPALAARSTAGTGAAGGATAATAWRRDRLRGGGGLCDTPAVAVLTAPGGRGAHVGQLGGGGGGKEQAGCCQRRRERIARAADAASPARTAAMTSKVPRFSRDSTPNPPGRRAQRDRPRARMRGLERGEPRRTPVAVRRLG